MDGSKSHIWYPTPYTSAIRNRPIFYTPINNRMPAIARKGDRERTHCSPPFRGQAFFTVFANNKRVSGLGHLNTPHLKPCACPVCCCVHTAPLRGGSPNVFAERIPVGRVGDPTCTAVAQGSPNVFANGAGSGGAYAGPDATSLANERANAGIIDATQTEGSF